jgi:hypothetical protein
MLTSYHKIKNNRDCLFSIVDSIDFRLQVIKRRKREGDGRL